MESLAFYSPDCIIRSVTDDVVRGTAIVYYDGTSGTECMPTEYGGQTIERLASGSMDEAITRSKDVIATYDHNQANLLGRTSSGTLKLIPISKGVDFELRLPNTTLGRDVREMIARGDLVGCSFIAKPDRKSMQYTKQGDTRILTITRFSQLAEITLTPFPYYAAAHIKRSRDLYNELEDELKKMEETQKMIEKIKNIVSI